MQQADNIIPVDFSGVEDYGDVPLGVYEGHIEKIVHRLARKAGKFDQLSVTLVVDGGDHDGERTWQNLSFSPKAARRMKRFFDLFELTAGLTGFVLDPDAGPGEDRLLLEPSLDGEPVRFEVKDDSSPDYPNSTQTEVIAWLGNPQTTRREERAVTEALGRVPGTAPVGNGRQAGIPRGQAQARPAGRPLR